MPAASHGPVYSVSMPVSSLTQPVYSQSGVSHPNPVPVSVPMPTINPHASAFQPTQPQFPSQPSMPVQPQDATCYHSLPAPWNVLPRPGTSSLFKENQKLSGFVTAFKGKGGYAEWRELFISRVHRMDILVGQKVRIMIASLEQDWGPLSSVMMALCELDDYEGYRQVIMTLEEMYGGPTQDLREAGEKLSTLPVASTKEQALHLFSTVKNIADAAKRQGFGELGSNLHDLLFEAIESKMPSMYQAIYRVMVAEVYGEENVPLSFLEHFIRIHLFNQQKTVLQVLRPEELMEPRLRVLLFETKKIKTTRVTMEKADDGADTKTSVSGASAKTCSWCDVDTHTTEQCQTSKKLPVNLRRPMAKARLALLGSRPHGLQMH